MAVAVVERAQIIRTIYVLFVQVFKIHLVLHRMDSVPATPDMHSRKMFIPSIASAVSKMEDIWMELAKTVLPF